CSWTSPRRWWPSSRARLRAAGRRRGCGRTRDGRSWGALLVGAGAGCSAGGSGPHGSGEVEVTREHLLLTAVRGEVLAHRRLTARRDLGARDRLLGGVDVVRLEVAHDHAVLGPQEEGVV